MNFNKYLDLAKKKLMGYCYAPDLLLFMESTIFRRVMAYKNWEYSLNCCLCPEHTP